MKTLGIYTVDQDPRTTTTLGVYTYTRRLLHVLAERPDPGFRVIVWTAPANAADFTPPAVPAWMTLKSVPGAWGTGARRLWADHVLAPALARRDAVDAVHFPKGWLPLAGLGRRAAIVTLHDTITQYYRVHYPRIGRSLKWRYFDALMRRSARRAEAVITISQASADALEALVPDVRSRLTIAPSGELPDRPAPPGPRRDAVLVIGSTAPHKATAETLRLLDAWAARRPGRQTVVVTGLAALADQPDAPAPRHLDLCFEGRVPAARMSALLGECRALVFLSEVEGFGLPLLEAYAMRTPVCYRNASSLAEVMAGAPGGWDGRTPESFFAALEAALALTPEAVERIRADLQTRYAFADAVARTVAVYAAALGLPTPSEGSGGG